MRRKVFTFLLIVIAASTAHSEDFSDPRKFFSKKEIIRLSDVYINNNLKIKNPVFADVDDDGDFDILKFTKKGSVEYYKNTGTLEAPLFNLEDKKFDSYEVNSFLPNGLLLPVFFADGDGDKDADVFGIVSDGFDAKTFREKYEAVYVENTMELDHYTLITIILVLVIILLVVLIVK